MTRTAIRLEQIAPGCAASLDAVRHGPEWSGDGIFAPSAPAAAGAIRQVVAQDAAAGAGGPELGGGRRRSPERGYPAAGIFALCEALIGKIQRRPRMHRDDRLLMRMNERNLADIGLSRDQLRSLLRQGRDGAGEWR